MVTKARDPDVFWIPKKLAPLLHATNLEVMLRSGLPPVRVIKMETQHYTSTAISVDVNADSLGIECVSKVQFRIRCPDAYGNVVVPDDETVSRLIDLAEEVDRKWIAKVLRRLGCDKAEWISRRYYKMPRRRRLLLVFLTWFRTRTLGFEVANRIDDGAPSFLIEKAIQP
jgi:hypothetical protein